MATNRGQTPVVTTVLVLICALGSGCHTEDSRARTAVDSSEDTSQQSRQEEGLVPTQPEEMEVEVLEPPSRENQEWVYTSAALLANASGMSTIRPLDINAWSRFRVGKDWRGIGFFDQAVQTSLVLVVHEDAIAPDGPIELAPWDDQADASAWLMRHRSNRIQQVRSDWADFLSRAYGKEDDVGDEYQVFRLTGRVSIRGGPDLISSVGFADGLQTNTSVPLDESAWASRLRIMERRLRRVTENADGQQVDRERQRQIEDELAKLREAKQMEDRRASIYGGAITGRWIREKPLLDIDLLP